MMRGNAIEALYIASMLTLIAIPWLALKAAWWLIKASLWLFPPRG